MQGSPDCSPEGRDVLGSWDSQENPGHDVFWFIVIAFPLYHATAFDIDHSDQIYNSVFSLGHTT